MPALANQLALLSRKEGKSMKATSAIEEQVTLSFKSSGAEVLQDLFHFNKTIGLAVAAKKGLSGGEATAYAERAKRTLRRARKALENR